MKIIIFYASYGGGHLNAAKSINEYILENYKNVDIELIDCMKYINKTIEKVTTSAYNEMAKKVPWAWGKIYADSQKGPLAHLSSRSNKIMAIKLLKLLREKNADLIISTHPFGSQMCSYLKRKGKINSKIATIMTDFAPHDQWLVGSDFTDYFFVAHDKMKQYLINKNIPEEKIFSTGIPISTRFTKEYDKEKLLKEFNLQPGKQTVLFFGGGEYGLGKSKTFNIFENLIQANENMQVIAISGKNPEMKKEFENIIEKHNKSNCVKLLSYTNKVPELMSISDLVVTKPGGLTTSESLASHLPMIIINPIPGQEKENAEFLENHGIAVWIKNSNESKMIFELLLSNKEKLEDMKKNTSILAKPFSTAEICKILLDH